MLKAYISIKITVFPVTLTKDMLLSGSIYIQFATSTTAIKLVTGFYYQVNCTGCPLDNQILSAIACTLSIHILFISNPFSAKIYKINPQTIIKQKHAFIHEHQTFFLDKLAPPLLPLLRKHIKARTWLKQMA